MEKIKKGIQKSEGRIFRIFEFLTELIGWLEIVVSPLLLGLAIGAVIYFSDPTFISLIVGIIVSIIGLIIGIIWATKQWKGKGTVWFMSRIKATQELDNPDGKNFEPNTLSDDGQNASREHELCKKPNKNVTILRFR